MRCNTVVSDVTIDDNSLWSVLEYGKKLFKYDLETNEVKEQIKIDKCCEAVEGRFYHAIVKSSNKIIVIPTKGLLVKVFDEEQQTISNVDLSDNGKLKSNGFELWRAYADDECFFITGYAIPYIFVIDKKTMKIKRRINLENSISVNNQRFNGYFMDGCLYDDDLYIPVGCCNSLVKLNMKSNEYDIKDMELGYDGVFGVGVELNRTWFVGLNDNTNIITCVDNSKNISKFKLCPQINVPSPFWRPIVGKKYIFLLPNNFNRAYIIDKNTGNGSPWEEFEEYVKKKEYSFHSIKQYDDQIFMFDLSDGVWHVYSEGKDEFNSFEIRLEKPYEISDFSGEIIHEGVAVDLNKFLDLL